MQRIGAAIIEGGAALVFLLPLIGLYGKFVLRDGKRTLLYLVFAFYLAAVLALVGFPSVTDWTVELRVNLVPFTGMVYDVQSECLNVLLFVPLGIFLPLLWEKYRKLKNTFFAALSVSLFIELSQLFTFRATDINDLITNSLGALAGYLLAQIITGGFARASAADANSRELYLISGVTALVMFFLQPFVSDPLWGILLT